MNPQTQTVTVEKFYTEHAAQLGLHLLAGAGFDVEMFLLCCLEESRILDHQLKRIPHRPDALGRDTRRHEKWPADIDRG